MSEIYAGRQIANHKTVTSRQWSYGHLQCTLAMVQTAVVLLVARTSDLTCGAKSQRMQGKGRSGHPHSTEGFYFLYSGRALVVHQYFTWTRPKKTKQTMLTLDMMPTPVVHQDYSNVWWSGLRMITPVRNFAPSLVPFWCHFSTYDFGMPPICCADVALWTELIEVHRVCSQSNPKHLSDHAPGVIRTSCYKLGIDFLHLCHCEWIKVWNIRIMGKLSDNQRVFP